MHSQQGYSTTALGLYLKVWELPQFIDGVNLQLLDPYFVTGEAFAKLLELLSLGWYYISASSCNKDINII